MTSASTNCDHLPAEFDIWLDAGREGKTFTYKDGLFLGVDLGDLVKVKLKGRYVNGLVVHRKYSPSLTGPKLPLKENKNKYRLSNIDEIIQKSAVDFFWLKWLESVARQYYTSTFKMLKTAFPPGWFGKGSFKLKSIKKNWWIYLSSEKGEKIVLNKKAIQLESFLLSKGGGAWQKELYAIGFSSLYLKKSLQNGLISREKRMFTGVNTCSSKYDENSLDQLEQPRELTIEQRNAISIFKSQKKGSSLLLWGITGSGKTEVYLHLIFEEIKIGRSCLVLTPEIGLIPQLVDRFRKRFGSKVLEYHSGCSPKERINTWKTLIDSGEESIVVGTRSAIFLPLPNLGLIVIDEEHDNSYKQESPMPCYNARDIALKRAEIFGSKVILGSATPSLKTWKNLEPNGPIKLAKLTKRISDKPIPIVNVVDMRGELLDGHKRLISRSLMKKLSSLPEKGEQAVLLVPRRGYSSFLSCRSCGDVVQCPNCDISLTVHKRKNGYQWLRCHWCDFRAPIEPRCRECGSTAFKPFGAGTQKVMDLLAKELEGVKFLRFDRDTTGGRDGHRDLLARFSAGEADVLIGTQMLAKGMDLPRVTLAAVLAADGLLHRPDLFACEESLQLFMQLAGRAGRGELPGEVLVQTYCPDHPVILHLVDGRYERFLQKEQELRKDSNLIPYRRACLIRLSGLSSSSTADGAHSVARKIKYACNLAGWEVIGPAPSLVARVAGKDRWQLLLHGPENSLLPLPNDLSLWTDLPNGVTLSVDPDPIKL